MYALAIRVRYAFGGEIVRADRIMHGKLVNLPPQRPTLSEIPSPFEATR